MKTTDRLQPAPWPSRRAGRSRPARRCASALVVCGAAGLAACSSPPTRFYTVEPAAPAAPAPTANGYGGPPLRVRAVHLPPVWDRVELVREVGPGQVRIREFDLWAAPLGRSAQQALIQNLAARMPSGAVLLTQVGPGAGVEPAELSVDIVSLKVDGRTASMAATWSWRRSPTDGWRSPPLETVEVPLTGDSGDATALAISQLIGQLADRIVVDLGGDRNTPAASKGSSSSGSSSGGTGG